MNLMQELSSPTQSRDTQTLKEVDPLPTAASTQELIDVKDKKFMVKPHMKKFPLSITWTCLPIITQMIPCIGHTGIGDSKGVIHDFAGPYYVSLDDFAFGETHKYVVLRDLECTTEQLDEAIEKADVCYRKRMHNLFCDNCHSHVARVLNNLEYRGRSNYTMIDVWWMCITQSTYVTYAHIFYTYILWVFVGIIVGVSYLLK